MYKLCNIISFIVLCADTRHRIECFSILYSYLPSLCLWHTNRRILCTIDSKGIHLLKHITVCIISIYGKGIPGHRYIRNRGPIALFLNRYILRPSTCKLSISCIIFTSGSRVRCQIEYLSFCWIRDTLRCFFTLCHIISLWNDCITSIHHMGSCIVMIMSHQYYINTKLREYR